MIHALAHVALAQLLPNKPAHHTAHPLLADDRVACIVDRNVVFVVYAVEGRRHRGLFGQEGFGFGGGHFGFFSSFPFVFFVSDDRVGWGPGDWDFGGGQLAI